MTGDITIADTTHICTACREQRPLNEFDKWRRGLQRPAWYCDACRAAIVTSAVRKYRSDPEKRERDREASRRWKREHLGQPGKPKAA